MRLFLNRLVCFVCGHDWFPYDFGVDRCLRCGVSRIDHASSL
jgi:hypothetical protein